MAVSLRRFYANATAPEKHAGTPFSSSCATTSEVNASCSLLSSMYIVTFNAVQTGANPSCRWNCSGCPDVAMDTASGLPVELLDFELEESGADDEDRHPEERLENPE